MIPTQQSGPGQNSLTTIISILAGSGFGSFASGIKKLAESGVDVNQLSSLPNFPLLLAGAGVKDAANSMDLIAPLMKQLMPPPPPPEAQINPEHQAAASEMMSAKLGQGLQGIKF